MMSGIEADAIEDRWRICVQEVDTIVPYLLSNAFIQRAFSIKDKQLGDQIVTDIKGVFIENLKSLNWMSQAVKEAATRKGRLTLGLCFYPRAALIETDQSLT
jgi:endothelin-converting enzyme